MIIFILVILVILLSILISINLSTNNKLIHGGVFPIDIIHGDIPVFVGLPVTNIENTTKISIYEIDADISEQIPKPHKYTPIIDVKQIMDTIEMVFNRNISNLNIKNKGETFTIIDIEDKVKWIDIDIETSTTYYQSLEQEIIEYKIFINTLKKTKNFSGTLGLQKLYELGIALSYDNINLSDSSALNITKMLDKEEYFIISIIYFGIWSILV